MKKKSIISNPPNSNLTYSNQLDINLNESSEHVKLSNNYE